MVALELRQLDLRYAPLRIVDPTRRARLGAAIAQERQRVPVLVVPAGGDRLGLISEGMVASTRSARIAILELTRRSRGTRRIAKELGLSRTSVPTPIPVSRPFPSHAPRGSSESGAERAMTALGSAPPQDASTDVSGGSI